MWKRHGLEARGAGGGVEEEYGDGRLARHTHDLSMDVQLL